MTTFSGQVKVVGMGAVQGVDTTALMPLIETYGLNKLAALELLPYLEAGILSGSKIAKDNKG